MIIKILVNFMWGKASRFFMKHVALCQKDWTLKSIYEALFNYCFPPDFKLQLREQLTRAKQGKNDVRDFQRDLETLAVRFPDVTERQIRQIFWSGIRGYLRLHLVEKGLNPEHSSIQKLVKYASRHEAARKTLKPKRNGISYSLSTNFTHSMRARAGRGSRSNSDNTESDQAESDSPSVARSSACLEDHREKDSSSNRIFLPQEEYLRLRQESRCFKCKVRGHLSRNCPGDQEEELVEASAVHFFEEEEEYSDDYETESDEISAPEISHQTNI
jgi:hypothetical protein